MGPSVGGDCIIDSGDWEDSTPDSLGLGALVMGASVIARACIIDPGTCGEGTLGSRAQGPLVISEGSLGRRSWAPWPGLLHGARVATCARGVSVGTTA